jgi:hypothetical protein
MDETTALVGERTVTTPMAGWSMVTLGSAGEIAKLQELFLAAYARVKTERADAPAT